MIVIKNYSSYPCLLSVYIEFTYLYGRHRQMVLYKKTLTYLRGQYRPTVLYKKHLEYLFMWTI